MMQRKIGAFELAAATGLVELVFGSGPRGWLFAGLSVGLYFAKKHLGGEFSIAELRELVTSSKKTS